MRLGTKRQIWAALAVLATLSLTAAGYTHGRGRSWWFRPPAPAIQDVSFTDAEAEDGKVRTIVVTGNQVTSYSRTRFDDVPLTATVATGVLTIDPIILLSDDGLTRVTVTFDSPIPPLQRNFFNSTFTNEGTAIIETLDSPGGSVLTTTTVDVFVFGAITEKRDEYKLRAEVRGFLADENPPGTTTYTLFKLELEGETAVPTVP